MAEKKMKTMNFGGDDTYVLSPDWDKIDNAPFGERTTYGDTLTWDGNTEGLEVLTLDYGDLGIFYMYKVADLVPALSDVQNGLKTTLSDGSSVELSYEEIASGYEYAGCITSRDAVVIPEDNFDFYGDGSQLLSKGIYFTGGDTYCTSLTINGYNGFETTETVPLPNKYLDIIETVGGDTLTWDRDTSGRESVDLGVGFLHYFMTDATPTTQEMIGATVVINGVTNRTLSESDITAINDTVTVCCANTILIVSKDMENGDMVVKKGTYFAVEPTINQYPSSLTINGYTGFTKEQVKEEYLPSGAYIVTVTTEDGGTYTADKSYEEIKTAYNDGKTIDVTFDMSNLIGSQFVMKAYLTYVDDMSFTFTGFMSATGVEVSFGAIIITINADGVYYDSINLVTES